MLCIRFGTSTVTETNIRGNFPQISGFGRDRGIFFEESVSFTLKCIPHVKMHPIPAANHCVPLLLLV